MVFFPYNLSRKIWDSVYKRKKNLSFIINNKVKMGSLIARIMNSLSDVKAKVLMLGLDNAGKTTILYKLKLNETLHCVPTIGFNVEEVQYKNLKFNIWDIGGQTRLMNMWHYYFDGSDAVIYVLDSADTERLEDARSALHRVIQND